ncbi:hypothetical protein GCM10025868_29500 [Angustibacter aerolatus]|uniref:Uncharacterized protein n=1 Tax=Angustibacter aerolatus TaxID=1162965 RepID=A0ABQ6JLN9_9ACTN|nr:hypothetical protein [Angustibacter aerolatus]GMA87700.1 hypothetical protein GCM10025868_29500 [Angustibacter aerolatus]
MTPPKGTKVWVQQARDGRHWTTLGYVPTDRSGAFSIDGYLEHPSGSFRLVYNGTSVLQGSTSRTVELSRNATRVTGYKVTSKVRKGKLVRLRGTVQHKVGGTWKSIGSKRYVDLFFRAKGSKTFKEVGWVRTDSRGRFDAGVKATKTGYYTAVWFSTNSKDLNAESVEKYVKVVK